MLPGHAAPIAAVLFDLDRTLIGRRTAHLGRIAAFLHEQFGVGGAPLDHGHSPSLAARLLARPYDALRRHVTLPPAACAVLDALEQAGLPVGIVTNGHDEKYHTLDLLGLRQRTACVLVSQTAGRRKPDPSLFVQAARSLGAPPAQILFVGDKLRQDIRGAQAVGMATAWVRRGPAWLARVRHPRPRATVVLPTLAALLDVLDHAEGRGGTPEGRREGAGSRCR